LPATSRSTRTTSRSAFVRASGPGGQNVNKLATARNYASDTRKIALPEDAAARLVRLAGQRMTKDGVIVIHAQRFRTQERNRADCDRSPARTVARGQVRPGARARHQATSARSSAGSRQEAPRRHSRRSRGAARFDD